MADNGGDAEIQGRLNAYEGILVYLLAALPDRQLEHFTSLMLETKYGPAENPHAAIRHSEMSRVVQRILPMVADVRQRIQG